MNNGILFSTYFIGLLLPIGKTHSQSMEFIPNQDSDGSVKLNSFFQFFKFSFSIRTCQKSPNLEIKFGDFRQVRKFIENCL